MLFEVTRVAQGCFYVVINPMVALRGSERLPCSWKLKLSRDAVNVGATTSQRSPGSGLGWDTEAEKRRSEKGSK